MVTTLMLLWIGLTLSAPAWYWWCWGICMFIDVIRFGIDMYKLGSE